MNHSALLQKKKLFTSLSRICQRGTTMKQYKKFVIGGLLCCSFALMTGCSSSKLADIWSNDPAVQTPSLHWVLVISVGKNAEQRRIWEDAFSVELAKHNIAATPSYRLFPNGVPDTIQVMQYVRLNGFDGVLVSLWLP